MKNLCRLPRLIVVLLAFFSIAASASAKWHHPLHLDRGGYWRHRLTVQIDNDSQQPAEGAPVPVKLKGSGPARAMIGARAGRVRVCDASGTEMLFRISGPNGASVERGEIPAGSVLILPAECPAGESATYYVYFDNPEAWAVPDFLEAHLGVSNGGMEMGDDGVPAGWDPDAGDEKHRVFWVSENPHSGKKCLKTVVDEGAEATWISHRQRRIHISGGARYRMTAWVRAEGVKGFAGWYLHVGNDQDSMIHSGMLRGGDGTYGWRKVSTTFTAPEEATRANLGTVLRGTGTAWFDDVTLELLDGRKISATVTNSETLRIRETGTDDDWQQSAERWPYRCPVKVINPTNKPLTGISLVDIHRFGVRLGRRGEAGSVRLVAGDQSVTHTRIGDMVAFAGEVPAKTARTSYAYFSGKGVPEADSGTGYEDLLLSKYNLVENPSFESDKPKGWEGGASSGKNTEAELVDGGRFGSRCSRIHAPHDAEPGWFGYRQKVPVEGDQTYLLAAWLKTEDIRNGDVKVHIHYLDEDGENVGEFASTGDNLSGTNDWTLASGTFTMPADCSFFQIHLTMSATGTLWHDGVLLARAARATAGRLQVAPGRRVEELTAWPVNPVVKVFQDDPPPTEIENAALFAARNEKEPLQLAVRSPKGLKNISVQVDEPKNASGGTLGDVKVGVVGYVPIDHKTSYYRTEEPTWHRFLPKKPGGCDGWPGMWPDPILPRRTFHLEPNTTQPVWLTVSVPENAAAGDYTGTVRLVQKGKTLKEVPFSIHVWDFALPDDNNIAAIYDLRLGRQWRREGQSLQETRRQFWRFMAEYRACPDRIRPAPDISYKNGQVRADFSEYDEAAEFYFDEMGFTHTYTPRSFYLFGWGRPPSRKFGEQPYSGEYPYEGTDWSKLRPEYKEAYQACVKAYWDHMNEKGWADRCILYISDEPWYRLDRIKTQMKALCDMIHGADPDIPIFSSTWHHRPEWEGYLDVWGIGHDGRVEVETMKELSRQGDRLRYTTDGQMCTDTPYCAVERLLPHYCFHYGVEAYEFWGVSWLTYNPYEYGWHSYIHQSGEPGESFYVRYPNGDGFLAYPGKHVDHSRPVPSVRLAQVREGVEDYEYLHLLKQLAEEKGSTEAREALRKASALVEIPNAGGRYSSKILPDPEDVLEVKKAVAEAIERLQ